MSSFAKRVRFRTVASAVPLALFVLGGSAAELPDAPGHDTVKKVCSACHPAEIVLGQGMNREQWGNLVSNMIGRGAKGTDAEFSEIVEYLATNLPGKSGTDSPAKSSAVTQKKPRGGGLLAQAGAADKQVVDEESAGRGKTVYIAKCITCHGPRARGNQQGPDLVRSLVILHDRYGSTIGPYLATQHPMPAGVARWTLSEAQVQDLANFLHQQVEDTLRTGPHNSVLNVLTGNPKAGEVFFNGAGNCTQCHSVTGNLAHIASKYDPPTLQLKTVFPQAVAFGKRKTNTPKKQETVTVTLPSGESITGPLQEIDDFSVSLYDASGQYRTFARTDNVKVERHDPFAAHEALLDRYTDQNIHDLVAYLETLK